MIPLSSISEAVKNHDDTKIFRPADYDDFMRWLDYADTEEKLFSRLGYWMVMQGLPDDRNQKYDMVRERAQELKLWNGLELKLRRWMDNSAEEFKRLGEKAYTALIGQDYASYKNNAPSEPVKALAPLCLKDIHQPQIRQGENHQHDHSPAPNKSGPALEADHRPRREQQPPRPRSERLRTSSQTGTCCTRPCDGKAPRRTLPNTQQAAPRPSANLAA